MTPQPMRDPGPIRSDRALSGWGDSPLGDIQAPWLFLSFISGFGLIILGLLAAMLIQWPLETALMAGFVGLCAAIGKVLEKMMGL